MNAFKVSINFSNMNKIIQNQFLCICFFIVASLEASRGRSIGVSRPGAFSIKVYQRKLSKGQKLQYIFASLDCLVVGSNSFALQMGEIIFRRTIAISKKDLNESYFLNQNSKKQVSDAKNEAFFKPHYFKNSVVPILQLLAMLQNQCSMVATYQSKKKLVLSQGKWTD